MKYMIYEFFNIDHHINYLYKIIKCSTYKSQSNSCSNRIILHTLTWLTLLCVGCQALPPVIRIGEFISNKQ